METLTSDMSLTITLFLLFFLVIYLLTTTKYDNKDRHDDDGFI